MRLEFQSSKDVYTVYNILSHPEKFVAIHPLIYKMESLGKSEYKVFEKIKLGVFNYNFNYLAKIISNPSNHVITMQFEIKKLTKVELIFSIQKSDNTTRIIEDINIKSLLPIKNYMYKLIKEQHTIMFNNLEKISF